MPVEVVDLVEPDVVVLAFRTARRRFHNHDLRRLRAILEMVGPQAHVYESKQFLRLTSYGFSIAKPYWWEPDCNAGPTHGFIVSGRDLGAIPDDLV